MAFSPDIPDRADAGPARHERRVAGRFIGLMLLCLATDCKSALDACFELPSCVTAASCVLDCTDEACRDACLDGLAGATSFVVDGLVVCGRVKELITVAGRNVFPTEVERVAAQVRGVREGAVVAVGTAADALRPGLVITAEFRGPDEAGARAELVSRVASQCGLVPADVRFVAPGTLPRTSSGKLRRLAVKQELEVTRG